MQYRLYGTGSYVAHIPYCTSHQTIILYVLLYPWYVQSVHERTQSVSVYYVTVRTIVLSRHASNLARPVIIHDIIRGLIYVQSIQNCGFFGSCRMETAPTSNEVLRPTQSQSNETSDLRGFLSPTTSLHACPSVYSTWLSQAATHPIIDRARRCLTSVIEPTPIS